MSDTQEPSEQAKWVRDWVSRRALFWPGDAINANFIAIATLLESQESELLSLRKLVQELEPLAAKTWVATGFPEASYLHSKILEALRAPGGQENK